MVNLFILSLWFTQTQAVTSDKAKWKILNDQKNAFSIFFGYSALRTGFEMKKKYEDLLINRKLPTNDLNFEMHTFGLENIPRFTRDILQAKLVLETLCKVKILWFSCKVVANNYNTSMKKDPSICLAPGPHEWRTPTVDRQTKGVSVQCEDAIR